MPLQGRYKAVTLSEARPIRLVPGRPRKAVTTDPIEPHSLPHQLRVYLKTTRGAVFEKNVAWQGSPRCRADLLCSDSTKENTPHGSSTEEQRSQTAFFSKTLRAAGLLAVARVGSVVTARCGDAPTSPPWPQPKSLAAAPLVIFKQALCDEKINIAPPNPPPSSK